MLSRNEIRKINKFFRATDESHLYPVLGRFNVTERAIAKARRIRQSSPCNCSQEYFALIKLLIEQIVNDAI